MRMRLPEHRRRLHITNPLPPNGPPHHNVRRPPPGSALLVGLLLVGMATPPCFIHHGQFVSTCGAGVLLSNCSTRSFDGSYTPQPPIDILPLSFTGSALRTTRSDGHDTYALKASNENGPDRHDVLASHTVAAANPLLARCSILTPTAFRQDFELAGTVSVSPWIDDTLPCATVLRVTPGRALRDSTAFFVDMLLKARLVDLDRHVDGWPPSNASSSDHNIFCRTPPPVLLQFDFDSAIDLRQPSDAQAHVQALARQLGSRGLAIENASHTVSAQLLNPTRSGVVLMRVL
jgi:hypothetical protein